MDVASNPNTLLDCLGASRLAHGTCVTIGNFDGVHAGHRALLERARQKAQAAARPLVTVTFDPHPLEVLAPHLAPPRLTDTRTRLRLLEACGVDGVLLLTFTEALAAMQPEDFVQNLLHDGLGMRDLLIGYDFSLGKGRAGNGTVLAHIAERLQFGCERYGPLIMGGQPVSSTRIRQLIRTGDMPGAAQLLGRPHSVHGEVIHGFSRGRLLGFPTANLAPPPVQLPPIGVYATRARLGVERYPAVTNIGSNPTFGEGALTVETHILDVNRDLYGQDLEVEFIRRIRGQITFTGPDQLAAQIAADIQAARKLLLENPVF